MNVPFADHLGLLHYTINGLMEKIGFNSKIKDLAPTLRPQYFFDPNYTLQPQLSAKRSGAASCRLEAKVKRLYSSLLD